MTNNDLNELILNPSMLPLVDTQELQEMAERYPYFQNIRFLSVKKHLIIQSPNYQKHLSTAATYAIDRKFLYDFLYEAEVKALPTGNLEGLEDENIDFEVIVNTEDEHAGDQDIPVFTPKNNSLSDILTENTSIDEDYYIDEEEDEVEGELAEEENEEVKGEQPSIEDDIDFRVRNILNRIGEIPDESNLSDAILRIRNMQLGKKEALKLKQELTEEQKIFQFHSEIEEFVGDSLETADLLGNYPEQVINNSETTFTFLEEDFEEEEEESAEIEELKAAMRKKHIERLRKSVEAFFKLDQEIENEAQENEILEDIPDDMSFKEWMKSLKKQYAAEDFPPATGIAAKIERSIEEDDELMSEALAELLVNQGNNIRAIKMYQHLILKFPEKKTFFAQKIKDLS